MDKFILGIRNREELDLIFQKYHISDGEEISKTSILKKTFKYPIYFRIDNNLIDGYILKDGYISYKEYYPEYPIITFDNLGISSVNISNEDELLLLL